MTTVTLTTPAGVAAAKSEAIAAAATDATTKAGNAQTAAVAAAATDATNKVAAETTRAQTAEATKVNASTYTAGLAAKADLVGGLVPTAQIPAIALTNGQAVANRAALLALSNVQQGDFGVITAGADKGTYMLTTADPTQFANWLLLNAPTDVVQSVNGQQGTVVLAAADVGAATTAQGTKADNALAAANNLSDVASASTARTNLGLGTAATKGTGTSAGTVAAGDDSRIVSALQALPVLTTVTAAAALTKGSTQPVDATAGAITMTALPALSTLAVGDAYAVQKTDSTMFGLTVLFAAGDTTSGGAPSVVLTLPGTATLIVANAATGGGKVWRVANHVRGDAVVAPATQLEAPDTVPLKRFRQALANIDTAPLNWLAIGDSLTEGSGATSIENTWVNRTRRAIQRDWTYAGKGGPGFVNTYVKTNPDLNGNVGTPAPKAYWTFAGGTAGVGGAGQPGGLLGARMRLMGVNETATLTFVGTGVDLHFTQGVTTAKPFTYSVDGAAAVTVTPSTTGGTNRQGRNTAIRGLASASHTVAFAVVTAGDALPILGATVYDGDETNGVRLLNDAQFGITSTAVAAATGPGGSTYLTDVMALWPNPALVTIHLPTNDPVNTIAADVSLANIQTIIANVKAKCTITPSFLLIAPSERGALSAGQWGPYVAAVRSVASADPTNIALLDLSLRIPDAPTTGNNYNQGLGKSDLTHMVDAGYLYVAQLILRRLLGDMMRAA